MHTLHCTVYCVRYIAYILPVDPLATLCNTNPSTPAMRAPLPATRLPITQYHVTIAH